MIVQDSVSAVILALLLAHMLGDFVLQTPTMVQAKAERKWSAYLGHGVVHYVLTIFTLNVFTSVHITAWPTLGVVLGLVIIHLTTDAAKAFVNGRGWLSDTVAFGVDQAIHVIALLTVGWFALAEATNDQLFELGSRAASSPVLETAVVYVAVIFGGGHVIRVLLMPFEEKLPKASDAEQLQNAGLYIGWLERFLLLTAMVAESPATVGLIVAAKSIFRFPELKGRPMAEYFLIGTLLSVSIAVFGALLLMLLLRA